MAGFEKGRSYLVECYWPGVSEDKLVAVSNRARAASEERRREGGDVDFVESILVPTDETVFCFFAGNEQDVRTVSARAGVPLERIVESVRLSADGTHLGNLGREERR